MDSRSSATGFFLGTLDLQQKDFFLGTLDLQQQDFFLGTLDLQQQDFFLGTLDLQQQDFFLGTLERVRNSRGKRAIPIRATDVLLCLASLVLDGLGYKICKGQRRTEELLIIVKKKILFCYSIQGHTLLL